MAGKKSKTKRKSTTARSAGKTAKKTTAKTTTTTKLPNFKDPLSKSGMIKIMTENLGVPRKSVADMLDCFTLIIEKHVKSGGPGKFVLPGLMKISVVKKPARPARKGINPFTGEEITFKAKPAYKAVKIKALKKLKEMVA